MATHSQVRIRLTNLELWTNHIHKSKGIQNVLQQDYLMSKQYVSSCWSQTCDNQYNTVNIKSFTFYFGSFLAASTHFLYSFRQSGPIVNVCSLLYNLVSSLSVSNGSAIYTFSFKFLNVRSNFYLMFLTKYFLQKISHD